MEFLYYGKKFDGLNPSGVTFQRQTNENSCWAACIANARSVLFGKDDIIDIDIYNKNHDGFHFIAVHENNIVEYIAFVSEMTGVQPVPKEKWDLPDALEGVCKALSHGYPCMIGLNNPSGGVGHDVLALAWGGPFGTHFLVYDPQENVTSPPGSIASAIQVAMQGGLTVLDYGFLQNYGRWAIPLRRRI